jgi:HK97 gp10 family phage protein
MTGVVRGVESVIEEADSLMRETPRTGREYRRGKVTHIASSPGNPPAIDTGRLRQGLRTEYNQADLSGTAIASTEYAASLEFGTEKMAPRPFMRPALANRREEIEADISDEIRSVLK